MSTTPLDDIFTSPDVPSAIAQLRAVVSAANGGGYGSAALRTALYDALPQLLNRAHGEHSDASVPYTATCWWDYVDFSPARETRDAPMGSNTSPPAEAARARAANSLQDLMMPGNGARESLFTDPTTRGFGVPLDMLPHRAQRAFREGDIAIGRTPLPHALTARLAAVDPLTLYLLTTPRPVLATARASASVARTADTLSSGATMGTAASSGRSAQWAAPRSGVTGTVGALQSAATAAGAAAPPQLQLSSAELLLLYLVRYAVTARTRRRGFAVMPGASVAFVSFDRDVFTVAASDPLALGLAVAATRIARLPSAVLTAAGEVPFVQRPLGAMTCGHLTNMRPWMDHLFTLLDVLLPTTVRRRLTAAAGRCRPCNCNHHVPAFPFPAPQGPANQPAALFFLAAISSCWLLANDPSGPAAPPLPACKRDAGRAPVFYFNTNAAPNFNTDLDAARGSHLAASTIARRGAVPSTLSMRSSPQSNAAWGATSTSTLGSPSVDASAQRQGLPADLAAPHLGAEYTPPTAEVLEATMLLVMLQVRAVATAGAAVAVLSAAHEAAAVQRNVPVTGPTRVTAALRRQLRRLARGPNLQCRPR